MIKLNNIHKVYNNGFKALHDINLHIQKGDIYGIIGYSGAGKSSLIRIINLLENPTSGEVIVDNVNLLNLNKSALQKYRQKMGMIFQHFNLLSARDVFGNIAYGLEIAKWSKDKIKIRVEELLELVGLSDKKHALIKELSGGQKQRVAIARALANNPKVLLCDEATSALDSKTTKSILELLKQLQKKLELTIVLITHQMEVVRDIANKMCVIHNGNIVERGNVKDIFANPRHNITKELLSIISQDEMSLLEHFKSKHIYKIIFKDINPNGSLIGKMIKKFDIEVNIINANIDFLKNDSIGHLIMQINGQDGVILDALQWLRNNGTDVIKLIS